MTRRNRATNHEYQFRVDTIQAFLGRGAPSSKLIEFACQQWDVSERQAKRYLQAAKEQVEEQIRQPLERHYGQVWMELGYIYQKALSEGDLKLAQRITSDRMRLLKQLKAELPSLEPSRLMSNEALEEVIKSLEKEERNYPLEDDLGE